jgi:hypothetical protein
MLNSTINKQSSHLKGKSQCIFDVINKGYTDYAIKVLTGVYPKQINLEFEEFNVLENLYAECQ